MPRGDCGAMTRRSIGPAGPSIVTVSARGDFGGERKRAEPLQAARAHLLDRQPLRLGVEAANDLGVDRERLGGDGGGVEQGGVDEERGGHRNSGSFGKETNGTQYRICGAVAPTPGEMTWRRFLPATCRLCCYTR